MKRASALKRSAAMSRVPFSLVKAWKAERSFNGPSKPPKPRRPLKAKGARAKRVAATLTDFRLTVVDRARGVCERCGCRSRDPLDAHHVVRRSRAVGWPDLHNPEVNGLAVDRWCHGALTIDPLDLGGPCEAVARAAHAAFEAWRAGEIT